MEFVAIDFETTGYEHGADNRPWQLGAARVVEGQIVETREWFFGPDGGSAAGWPTVAVGAPSLMEQWPEFHDFLKDVRLVAHNISTERTILTRIAPLTRWGPWEDTLKLAKVRYPRLPSYALGDLCTMFGLVPQFAERSWHDGLFDAVACARLAVFLGG